MQKEGLGFNFRPSEYTFGSLITAAAESLNVDHGSLLLKQLQAKVEMYGFVEDLYVGSALVSSFARLGSIDIAKSIFQQMGTRNAVSVNGLMVGLVKLKQGEEAVELFLDLETWKIFSFMHDRDQVSWNSIIGAFTDSESSIVEGTSYFTEMMRAGRTPNSVTFINILSSAAHLSCVQLTHQNVGRDDVSWNSMISGYIHSEHLVEAMDLVWHMLHNGRRLDSFTFATVLSACASVATLEHGMGVHACATRADLVSDVVIGSALVDMYAKCGRIEAGEFDKLQDFINGMPIKPNVLIWRTVLGACGRANGRLLDLGRRAAQMIMELEPQNAVNYVLLSNMYASGEKWEHMAQARHAMKAAAAEKKPGAVGTADKDYEKSSSLWGLSFAFKYISAIVGRQIVLRDSNRPSNKPPFSPPLSLRAKWTNHELYPHSQPSLCCAAAAFLHLLFVSATAAASTTAKPSSFAFRPPKTLQHPSFFPTASNKVSNSQDQVLLTLLQQRKTEEAWLLYAQCAQLPNPTCLSRLVSQLSYLNTAEGLTRAQSIIQRLRREGQLHRLDANSLGLLAVAAAKGGTLCMPHQLSSPCLSQVISPT
ncbi:UNVERIFIED_CONTAM: putative pentatricopeptide repeat-containing protein [Sesamum radiatum]|uniref:Pentatricopeptide repeat-containing protein n=1 Tax=Sesamum radiatum TaxID=300843 RepID=A0AAW2R542_SESRA